MSAHHATKHVLGLEGWQQQQLSVPFSQAHGAVPEENMTAVERYPFPIHQYTAAASASGDPLLALAGLAYVQFLQGDLSFDDIASPDCPKDVQGILVAMIQSRDEKYLDSIEWTSHHPDARNLKAAIIAEHLNAAGDLRLWDPATKEGQDRIFAHNLCVLSLAYLVNVKAGVNGKPDKIKPGMPMIDFVASHPELVNEKMAREVLKRESQDADRVDAELPPLTDPGPKKKKKKVVKLLIPMDELIERTGRLNAELQDEGHDPMDADMNLATLVASNVHYTEKLKSGDDYAAHFLSVAMRKNRSSVRACIGLLHDAIENSQGQFTLDHLRRMGFSQRIIDGVDALTHREDEQYFDYIARLAENEDARNRKYQDMRHNMDSSRLIDFWDPDTHQGKKMLRRTNKYIVSMLYLTALDRKCIDAGTRVEAFAANHFAPEERHILRPLFQKYGDLACFDAAVARGACQPARRRGFKAYGTWRSNPEVLEKIRTAKTAISQPA